MRTGRTSTSKAKSISSYRFDTSNYVMVKGDVRRDSHSGRLIVAESKGFRRPEKKK